MSGTRRFFNISESADIRIDELLDNLETLGIEYDLDEFMGDDEEIGISGSSIIRYLTDKICNAFLSDFNTYVESVDEDVDFYDFDFVIESFNGTYPVFFKYRGVEFDDEFTDSYIVGDRDAVFAKLLEKCEEIDD